jgi:hypothetical protein
VSEWISVKERLPEINKNEVDVYVWAWPNTVGDVGIARYQMAAGRYAAFWEDITDRSESWTPRYWMPLEFPEPPKEK